MLFLEFIEKFFLDQIVELPTKKNNVLDLILTNNDNLFLDIELMDTTLSNHRIILGRMCMTGVDESSLSRCTKNSLKNFNFNSEKINWLEVREKLLTENWQELLQETDASAVYEKICEKIIQVTEKYIPKKRQAKKFQIPRDRKILMRKRHKIKVKLGFCKDREKDKLKKSYIEIEQKLKESHMKELNELEEKANNNIKNNPKYFYSYAKS